jgi:hypothetical protein
MQDNISFLKRRHASLFRAVEHLEYNRDMLHDFREIQDRIEGAISEVKAIRVAISDKISELEAAS